MNIRCPACASPFTVAPDRLLATGGLVRCGRCSTLFDALGEEPVEAPPGSHPPALDLGLPTLVPDTGAPAPRELPFDIPDDLEPLQPSPQTAIGLQDALQDAPHRHGLVYILLSLLLLVGFGLQLGWQYRDRLIAAWPPLERLCDHLPCRPDQLRAPERLQILQRDIQPAANQPGALTLQARVRNQAPVAQPFPDIQLSLLDDRGSVLLRRRLAPAEYIFPPPAGDRLIAPGEVFTISLDFQDPGSAATGFLIDFY